MLLSSSERDAMAQVYNDPELTATERRRDGFIFFCVYCGHDMMFHWKSTGSCWNFCDCDHFASACLFHDGEEGADPCD